LVVGVVLTALALVVGVGAAATPAAPVPAAGALLAGLVPGRAGPVPEVPACVPPSRACVDLEGERAWLLDGARVVRGPVRIAAGDERTPTPRGTFTVQWKAQAWTSREYGMPMPWSVFFAEGGIAFHEGPLDAASHGCVKLGPDDAEAFYGFLRVGDRVQVL
jgi:hypothetical protein